DASGADRTADHHLRRARRRRATTREGSRAALKTFFMLACRESAYDPRMISSCALSFSSPIWRVSRLFVLAFAALLLAGCGQDDHASFSPLSPDAVVLVIGDSLVAGTGAKNGKDWPRRLAENTGWQVINAGVPGDTSGDALLRLPELLDVHHPQAVIIAAGGNDFLRDVPIEETRANLEEMIHRVLDVTEHVALVAIPA